MATIASRAKAFWNHPAGPKTIHFWAPTFKWGISLANIADFKRPAESISTPQQVAVTATGLIWSRFATQIEPVSNIRSPFLTDINLYTWYLLGTETRMRNGFALKRSQV
jgi:mitochondrial pyruvate carrier 2